jgi:hypothetical protein
VRVFATGNGRTTDPVDARSVALAALRAPADPGLRRVEVDDDLVVMGLLVERRDELGRARIQTIKRLHRLLLELFPGGAKRFLSAAQPSSARTVAKSAPIPLERPTTTHVSPRSSRSIPALPSSGSRAASQPAVLCAANVGNVVLTDRFHASPDVCRLVSRMHLRPAAYRISV